MSVTWSLGLTLRLFVFICNVTRIGPYWKLQAGQITLAGQDSFADILHCFQTPSTKSKIMYV